MQTILAWLLVVFIIISAYPWAAGLLRCTARHDGLWLILLLTLALSTGTLTLLMFWEALVGIRLTVAGITVPYLIVMLPGLWLWRSSKVVPQTPVSLEIPPRVVWLIIGLISAAIVFNAVYWPFHRDDVIGIYGRYGREISQTGSLIPFAGRDDAFYQAYPMHIPLAYAFTFLASGWENQYLAGLIPALLSLGCLLAAHGLGRMLYGERAGWLAALFLALSPTFARWASSGYVDLPMAFFYILAAIFTWRLLDSNHWADALLAGIMVGLAAWTKNAGLFTVMVLGVVLVYAAMTGRATRKNLLYVLIACLVVAAPWYIRNWVEVRLIVPPTAWTDQAERTLSSLLIFILQPQNFAITGWVIFASVVSAVYHCFRRPDTNKAQAFLLILTLPFFAIWWALVSYDPRFLLLLLPLLSVLAGGWAARFWTALASAHQNSLRIVLTTGVVLLTIYILWISVEFKREIIANPIMGDEAKHLIVSKARSH